MGERVSFDCRICQAISFRYRRCLIRLWIKSTAFHLVHIPASLPRSRSFWPYFNEKQFDHWLDARTTQTDNWKIYFNRDLEKLRRVHYACTSQCECIQGENVVCIVCSTQQLNQIDFGHLYWYRWPQIENPKHCLYTIQNVAQLSRR